MKPLKVYCEISNGASTFVRNGWKNVFEYCGHTFKFFQENSNTFDLFNQFGPPDILIGTTYNFNNSLFKLTERNPDMKVILFGSAFGDISKKLDLNEYPIDYAKPPEVEQILKLKEKTGKPDYIFIHIPDEHLNESLGYWNNYGIKVVGIMNGADTFNYYPLNRENLEKYDVGFVGGYWPYKAKNLGPILERFCNEERKRYKIKIFGSGWNVPECLGNLDWGKDNEVFNSANICPNISEPHSYQIGDYIERLFKVPCAGGFLISDNVKDLQLIYPNNIVPIFKNYNEFLQMIDFYSFHKELRDELLKKQKEHVLKNHTYFHRVSKILKELNMNEYSENIMKGINV
jgi:hypothetical protein